MEQLNQGERNNPGVGLSFFYGCQRRGDDGVAAKRPVSSPLITACLVLCGDGACGYAGAYFPSKPPRLGSLLRAFWQFPARLWPALATFRQWRKAYQLARHRHHLALLAGFCVIVAHEM
jgi:hypothetical protein